MEDRGTLPDSLHSPMHTCGVALTVGMISATESTSWEPAAQGPILMWH